MNYLTILLTLATLLSTQAATSSLVGGVRVSTDTTGTNTIAANVVITNLNGGASRTALMARDVQVTNAVKVLSLTGDRVVGIGTDKALTNTTVSIATLEALSTAGTNNWINSGTTNSTLAGTAYPWGVEVTNHVNVGASGETGVILFTSTNGTYTASISLLADGTLVVTNNSVLVATIPLSSGYVGTGAKYFTDGSGFVTPSSPIGTVTNIDINPTNGRFPYRSNSTTFGDGAWQQLTDTNRLGYNGTNYAVWMTTLDTALGKGALQAQTSGLANTAIGFEALTANTAGFNNTAMGYRALRSLTSGIENVAIGLLTLSTLTASNSNVAIGNGALTDTIGTRNSALGHNSGRTNGIGNDNTFLGYSANPPGTGQTNEIVIGSSAIGNGSDTATIGNTSVSAFYTPNVIHIDRSETNVLYRSGGDLVYTNGGATVSLKVRDGSGNDITLYNQNTVGGLSHANTVSLTGGSGLYQISTSSGLQTVPLRVSAGVSGPYVEISHGGAGTAITYDSIGSPPDEHSFKVGGTNLVEINPIIGTTTNTPLSLNINGTVKPVYVGPADSGGTGFRQLIIAN